MEDRHTTKAIIWLGKWMINRRTMLFRAESWTTLLRTGKLNLSIQTVLHNLYAHLITASKSS